MKYNTTTYVILGLLSHEPMTGYDIKKIFTKRLSYFWDLSYGQIYPTLKELEKKGLVSKKVEINEKDQNRKIYFISKEGLNELKEWLEKPVEKEVFKYEILVKLFFSSQIPTDISIKNLQEFKQRNERNFNIMKKYEKELRKILDQNIEHFYFLTAVLLGKRVYQAHLDWANETIDMINNKKGD